MRRKCVHIEVMIPNPTEKTPYNLAKETYTVGLNTVTKIKEVFYNPNVDPYYEVYFNDNTMTRFWRAKVAKFNI
jgi:hypothetical protein